MSYTLIETAVQSVIQGMDRFGADQVTRGDYRVMDSGKDCVILLPGPFDVQDEGQNREIRLWTVYAELYTRAMWAGMDWIAFTAARDGLVDWLRKYPNLGQSSVEITLVDVGSEGDPVFASESEQTQYIGQRLAIRVSEYTDVTGGDYV